MEPSYQEDTVLMTLNYKEENSEDMDNNKRSGREMDAESIISFNKNISINEIDDEDVEILDD